MTTSKAETTTATRSPFPIMGNRGRTLKTVDWDVAEDARDQAEKNHGQTLETLAARGGLTAVELLAALNGEAVTSRMFKRPLAEVEEELKAFTGEPK